MSTSVPKMPTFLTVFGFACALFLAAAMPGFAEAQDSAVTENGSASELSTEQQPTETANHPYPIEKLLGGEVYGDFVLGPGKVELQIKPGETKVVEISVSNRTGGDRMFEVSAEDAAGSSDPTQTVVLLGSDRGPYSLKDYVSIPVPRFTIGHNERVRIPVTVSIPVDAEPGGLYGSILVSTVSQEAKSSGDDSTQPQSAVVARIGSLFFITIPGAVEKDGSLIEFGTTPPKRYYQSGPIQFGVLFENRGSIHLTPYGELRVTNMLGEEVGYVELEPWFVLPKANRLREVSWNRDFLFGRYTATISINRSYDDTIDTMSYSFWILPWKILLAGFATIFAVLFLIRTFFRTFEFRRKQ